MSAIIRYFDKQKALDMAVWLNFEHRLSTQVYAVVKSQDGQHLLIQKDHPSFVGETFLKLPNSYKNMDYLDIQAIAMDDNPLEIWEILRAMFSTVDGETLRFILKYQVPLNRFIRFELATRGYDEDHRWCGFEKAKDIWLK